MKKKTVFNFKGIMEGWINHSFIRLLMYIFMGAIMYILLLGQVVPETFELSEGQESPIDIYSPIDTVNEWETELRKEEAVKSIKEVYTIDPNIANDQINKLEVFFNEVLNTVSQTEITVDEKANLLMQSSNVNVISEEIIRKVVVLSEDKVKNLKYITKTTLGMVLDNGVKIYELNIAYSRLEDLILSNPFDDDDEIKNIAFEITKNFIKPNYFYDPEKTVLLRDEARNSVESVIIKKDEIIVKEGQKIDKQTYEKLKAVGLLKDTSSIWPYFGLLLIVTLLILLLFYSIERMRPELHQNNVSLLMLLIIFTLTILTISILGFLDEGSLNSPIGYLAPVAFGVMLIAVLINMKLSILSGAIFSIYTSLVFNTDQIMIFDFRYGFVALMGSTAGAFAIGRIKHRSSVLKAGLLVALFNVLAISVIIMFTIQSYEFTQGVETVLFAALGGLFSAILTIGLMPFFESVFGILSPIKLIELSNPNHPLLRKLLIETPGTYHHSIIVGNLAESAAEAIGANGLLARVGAYYHDLGKTKRPTFFIENQLNMDNPHDRISPTLSKNIIIAHTKDGVEMLKEYKLPIPIQDIALQHHGTSLLKYFYHKAAKDSDQTTTEDDYRYSGPKPQTKEAAIVSIADSVEAAVRSLSHPTNESIEDVVRKIIKNKLDDGQLNECDLTMKELEIAALSMLETIKGIFHTRIEYPDDKEINEYKGEKSS